MSAPNPTLAALGRVDLARIERAADAEMERVLARVNGVTHEALSVCEADVSDLHARLSPTGAETASAERAAPASTPSEPRRLVLARIGAAAAPKLLETGAASSSPGAADARMPAKAEREQGGEVGENSAGRHPRQGWTGRGVGVGLMPHRIGARDHSIKRFASTRPEPARVVALDAAHPASMEGRTIFPSSVVGAADSPRYLVSGHNNAKLGKVVTKGPWKDMPIYHVTLEERATCPRSCLLWTTCYGNALPFARRNDHTDPEFMPALDREVRTVARQHPQGFVVRLHTLGDFYSLEYLELWASLIVDLPNLHIFGYTARREDADDEESREIAHYIRRLTDLHWSRFAIRFSNQAGPEGTIVVDEPLVKHPGVVMCPAQMGRTEACATCGLCWAEGARAKTIGFLLHGRKRKRTKSERRKMEREQAASGAGTAPAPGVSAGRPARAEPAAISQLDMARFRELRRRYEEGASAKELAGPGFNAGRVKEAIVAAGGTLRTPGQAVRLARMMEAERRYRRPRSALVFAPGEQRRLIDEAVDAGRITPCPPAFAAPTPQAAKR